MDREHRSAASDFPRLVSESLPTTSNGIITSFSVLLHAYLLLTALVPDPTTPVAVVQTVLGIVYVTVLPGLLFVGFLGRDFDGWEALVFVVGTSLILVMLTGATINVAFVRVPFLPERPFDYWPLRIGLGTATLALTVAFRLSGRQPTLPRIRQQARSLVEHRFALATVLLPVVAVCAAVVHNRTATNELILVALVLVALVPLGAVLFEPPKQYYPLVLWMSALSLVLGHATLMINFQIGDAVREFYTANLVLTHGVWNPGFSTAKNGMLRIVILHPVYTQLTSLSLFWEFKIVHPLLLSLMAISLWLAFRHVLEDRMAFFAVFIFTSFHTFVVLYSRNTRSGIALVFVSLVVLMLVRDATPEPERGSSVLLLLFGTGVVVSHYGISTIFGAVLVGAYAVRIVLRLWRRESLDSTRTVFVGFYAVVFVLWNLRTSSGRVFEIVVTAGAIIVSSLRRILSGESVASNALATVPSSFTQSYIKFEFLLIVGLIGIGLSLIGLVATGLVRHLPFGDRTLPTDPNQWHFAFGSAGVGIMALAFAPISFFGIGRFWTISMVFLLPYAFVSLSVLKQSSFDLPGATSVIAVIIAINLLINTGAVAAVVDERSTQPMIDREDLIESGSDLTVFELYTRYTPRSDITAAQWIVEHRDPGSTIYGPGPDTAFPSHLFYTEYTKDVPPGGYAVYSGGDIPDGSYVYVNEYANREGLIYTKARGGIGVFNESAFVSIDALSLNSKHKIYDGGESEVYASGSN